MDRGFALIAIWCLYFVFFGLISQTFWIALLFSILATIMTVLMPKIIEKIMK